MNYYHDEKTTGSVIYLKCREIFLIIHFKSKCNQISNWTKKFKYFKGSDLEFLIRNKSFPYEILYCLPTELVTGKQHQKIGIAWHFKPNIPFFLSVKLVKLHIFIFLDTYQLVHVPVKTWLTWHFDDEHQNECRSFFCFVKLSFYCYQKDDSALCGILNDCTCIPRWLEYTTDIYEQYRETLNIRNFHIRMGYI